MWGFTGNWYNQEINDNIINENIINEHRDTSADMIRDYGRLSNPIIVAKGIYLTCYQKSTFNVIKRDEIHSKKILIATLADLNFGNLYISESGNSLLRVSKYQCLFAGKTFININPFEFGNSASFPIIMALKLISDIESSDNDIVKKPNFISGGSNNEIIEKTDDSSSMFHFLTVLPKYLKNYLSVLLKTERIVSLMNGLNLEGFFNFKNVIEIGKLKVSDNLIRIASSSLKIETLNSDELSSQLQLIDAPSNSNSNFSIYFQLLEKVTDFQVGQIAGPIKQIVEILLTVANATRSESEKLKFQIKGNIVSGSPSNLVNIARYYRFSFFFNYHLTNTELLLFKSFLCTLNIFSKSEYKTILPDFNDLHVTLTFEGGSVDSILPSFISRVLFAPTINEIVLDKLYSTPIDNLISLDGLYPNCSIPVEIAAVGTLLDDIEMHLKFRDLAALWSHILNSNLPKDSKYFTSKLNSVFSTYNSTKNLFENFDSSLADSLISFLSTLISYVPEDYIQTILKLYDKLTKQILTCFYSVFQINLNLSGVNINLSTIFPHSRLMLQFPSSFEIIARRDLELKTAALQKARMEELKTQKIAENSNRFSATDFNNFFARLEKCTSPEWQVTFENEGDTILSSRDDTDSSLPDLLNVNTTIEGVDVSNIFELFYIPERRLGWDKLLKEFRILESYSANVRVSLVVFETRFGVANREYLEYNQVQFMKGAEVVDGKSDYDRVTILSQSCFHNKAPNNPNHIRGETIFNGYDFKNLPGNKCKVTGISQRTYGGNLPSALISKVNSSVIGGWLNNFKIAARKHVGLN